MKRGSLGFISNAVLILFAGIGLAGCSNEPRTSANIPEIVHAVAVNTATRTSIPDWLEAVGTVRAAQTSQISSQISGSITEMRVAEGDRVQSGQLLALLDEAQPRAAAEQATAAATAAGKDLSAAESLFSFADTTLQRYQKLYEKKSVSPQEFDEIKARYEAAAARRDAARAAQDQATAALTQAQTSLGYTRVRAPFAGIITEKRVDTGTLATAGMPLFTIEDTRRFRLEAAVDESDIALVQIGKAIPVVLDAIAGREFAGKVSQVVPAADPASRSFLVKIDLPADSHVRSGLFGRARLPRGSRSALLIPYSAVVERGQLRAVFVVAENGVAQLRYVSLGQPVGPSVEVLAGLQDVEKFVVAPGAREFSGKQIAPQP
jgi:RND family efflux transporter MFP subunit